MKVRYGNEEMSYFTIVQNILNLQQRTKEMAKKAIKLIWNCFLYDVLISYVLHTCLKISLCHERDWPFFW